MQRNIPAQHASTLAHWPHIVSAIPIGPFEPLDEVSGEPFNVVLADVVPPSNEPIGARVAECVTVDRVHLHQGFVLGREALGRPL